MTRRVFVPLAIHGALLAAGAPTPLDPEPGEDGGLRWFSLDSPQSRIHRRLGAPRAAIAYAADLEAWHYALDESDHDEPSHVFVFRRTTGALIGVTRQYQQDRSVAALFPSYEVRYAPTPAGTAPYPILMRTLPQGQLLVAPGAAGPAKPTRQVLLVRTTDLARFYPRLERSR